jgi:hypothetical protein
MPTHLSTWMWLFAFGWTIGLIELFWGVSLLERR